MRPTPILVLLGLSILVAVGWFLFRQETGPTPQPAPVDVLTTPVAGDATAASGAVVPVADGASGAAAAPNESSDRVAAPGTAAATLLLRGRLVDGGRQPRAGVEVQLDTWARDNGFEFLPPSVLPPGANRRPEAKTKTAADGTFALPIAAEHRGRLSLPDAELVFAQGIPRVDPSQGVDLGDLTVLRAATIAGVVHDESGKPVADVKVSARSGALGFGTISSATTDRDGRFRLGKLEEGTWHVRTATAAFQPASTQVALAAEEQHQDLVLRLSRGAAISGQVVDDRGVPVRGSKVAAQRAEERGGMRIERFASDEAAVTDDAGYFTVGGLTGETASIRVFGAGHAEALAVGVAVGTGDLLITVQRLGTIEGVLVGLDGRPIAGSDVFARRDDGSGDALALDVPAGVPMFDAPSRVQTAADGSFRIEGVRPGPVAVHARGKAHLPVRHTGLTMQPAQSVLGVRLVADAGGAAMVTVVDAAGAPVAGAVVGVRRAPSAPHGAGGEVFARTVRAEMANGDVRIGGDDTDVGSGKTDEHGKVEIAALPAGPLEFRATHERHAAARPVVVDVPRIGLAQASLALREPGHVAVTVVGADGGAVAGAPFVIEGPLGPGEASTRARHTADAEGRLRVGPLAPGDYTAVLARDQRTGNVGGTFVMVGREDVIDASLRKFRVSAGDTTVIDLRKPMAVRLHGKVIGAAGPVVGCHVELAAGDGEMPQLPGLHGRNAVCDAEGRYEFTDVEPGRYTLRYGREQSVVKARHEVHVQGEFAEHEQDLLLRTGTFRVQAVVAGTGEPVADAMVELTVARQAGAGAPQERRMVMVTVSRDGDSDAEATTITMGQQRAKTGPDGWAQIDDVPVGVYEAKVSHASYADAQRPDQQVLERQVTDAGRVDMRAAGRMRGKVVAADGAAVPFALVEYRRDGEGDRDAQPAMGGRFSFASLTPGRYLVRARGMALGPGEPGPWGEEVAVEVKAGETATAEPRLPAR